MELAFQLANLTQPTAIKLLHQSAVTFSMFVPVT